MTDPIVKHINSVADTITALDDDESWRHPDIAHLDQMTAAIRDDLDGLQVKDPRSVAAGIVVCLNTLAHNSGGYFVAPPMAAASVVVLVDCLLGMEKPPA